MELSSKTTDTLGDLTAVGTGVLAWMYTSTKKWAASNPTEYTLKQRTMDAIGDTFGHGVAMAIDPEQGGAGADLHPKPFGWINSTTGYGIALGIADWIAGETIPKYAKDLDGLRKIVQGAATGLTLGGAIGGIFDPGPEDIKKYPGSDSGTPRGGSYVEAVVAHNRKAVQGA